MDVIERYMAFSDCVAYGEETVFDERAVVKVPFLEFHVGDEVRVWHEYTTGVICINDREVVLAFVGYAD